MTYSTERIPKMNVSKESDAAFMAELKRTDRPRYDRLIITMQTGAFRQTRQAETKVVEMPAPQCEHCGLKLPPDKRVDGRYCDASCRNAAYRSRKAG
jgi:hypothetical protein